MMKAVLYLLVLLTIFSVKATDDVVVDDVNDETVQQEFINTDDFQQDQMTEEMAEMMRNLYTVCVVISRQKINTYQQQFQTLQDLPKDVFTAVIKKATIEHVQICVMTLGESDLNTAIEQLQNRTFELANYDRLFMTIDPNQYISSDYDSTLSQEQDYIAVFIDQFDEAMKQQYGQNGGTGLDEDEDDDVLKNNYQPKASDFEPKILGVSSKDIGSVPKAAYVSVIVIIFFGIIFFAYKQLDKDDTQAKPMKKKSKSKKNN